MSGGQSSQPATRGHPTVDQPVGDTGKVLLSHDDLPLFSERIIQVFQ